MRSTIEDREGAGVGRETGGTRKPRVSGTGKPRAASDKSPKPRRRKTSATSTEPKPAKKASLPSTKRPSTTAPDSFEFSPEGNTAKTDVGVSVELKVPTHDEIAARAYELYLARGCVEGYAQDDWIRAERELLS